MRLKRGTPLHERYRIDTSGCWVWIGAIRSDGYGVLRHNGKTVRAHRFLYEQIRGAIPAGLDLDHLCRNRACCNPYHLEAVDRATNLRRGETITAKNLAKTHCPRGHAYDDENTAVYKTRNGTLGRWCRQCARERAVARNAGKYQEWLLGKFKPYTKRRERYSEQDGAAA